MTLSRKTDLLLLSAVRRIGRHPRFRVVESIACSLFLVIFAAILLLHLIAAAAR